jgi:hypothetical protein
MSFVVPIIMLSSVACGLVSAACFLYALTTKPRTMSWFGGDLWFRLPPEGIRFRNIGLVFYVCAVAGFGVGWLLRNHPVG